MKQLIKYISESKNLYNDWMYKDNIEIYNKRIKNENTGKLYTQLIVLKLNYRQRQALDKELPEGGKLKESGLQGHEANFTTQQYNKYCTFLTQEQLDVIVKYFSLDKKFANKLTVLHFSEFLSNMGVF